MKFNLKAIPQRDGDIAIVTGANSGVGFEVSAGLAQKDYKVVMACRNIEKAKNAKNEILVRSPDADIDILQLDLSDFKSVHNFATHFKKRYSKLNLLVNNAGVLFNKPTKNKAGVEMHFATNHLGHFLLTSLLIELIPDSSDSRVISLSSEAHKKAEIYFDDINCESQSKWDVPYAQSKLACLMFSDELQRRLKSTGKKMISVAAHPGGTDSDLFKNMPKFFMFILRHTFVPLFLHSAKSAAQPILMAALKDHLKGGEYLGPTGLFEMKGPPGIAKRTEYSKDTNIADKLWKISEKMTGQRFDLQHHQPTIETSL